MNNCFVSVGRKLICLLSLPILLVASSCATQTTVDSAPNQFGSRASSSLLESESEFLDSVADKRLKLVNDKVKSTLVFNRDETASGSLVRDGGDTLAMELDWVWENAYYCRAGTIGSSETKRKCESVRLFPGVGILLTYIDSDDPEEYWLFE